MTNDQFKALLTQEAKDLWRDMPWRTDTRPYYVLVSELMLQQTQVSRVVPKFNTFIDRFPDERSLAAAPLSDVLVAWQGLGYNRRAKFLHQAARQIVDERGGAFPEKYEELLGLPGVGKNTAGAICAYAFNQPAIFVETNIRTVYLHHFFQDDADVSDKQIIEKLEQTIDVDNPRRFYQNLMDYGSHLKASGVNNITRSKHYKKQSPLRGSVREVRGAIVRILQNGPMTQLAMEHTLLADDRFEAALQSLQRDGLVQQSDTSWHLTKH